MDYTELQKAIDAAQGQLKTCVDESERLEERVREATANVAAAESAFESDTSDAAWSRVAEARSARDRHTLALTQSEKRRAAAQGAVADAKRALLEAQFQEASQRATMEHWREEIAPDLVALIDLDRRMLAAADRIWKRWHEAQHWSVEASRIAGELGMDSYTRDAISGDHVVRHIRSALGVGPSRARMRDTNVSHYFKRDHMFEPYDPNAGRTGEDDRYFARIAREADAKKEAIEAKLASFMTEGK